MGDFTSFLLGVFKSEDDGRVALYHFLKNFYSPESIVKPELINDFYGEVLQTAYWQDRQKDLDHEVQDVIQKFFSQMNEPFRLDQVWKVDKLQIISLKHIEDLVFIAREHEQSLTQQGESVRVMAESESRALSVRRTALGEVIVRTYNFLMRIQGSKLLPLGPDQEIFYDPGMELKPGAIQRLRPGAHTQVRFSVDGPQGSITALFVSGAAFRQAQTMAFAGVHQEPRIFFPLKRLERFYIHRPSDPYYMELISSLERALLLFQTQKENAYEVGRQAFDNAQIAFDQIFPDDKALYSRLRELAKWISSPQVLSRYKKEESSDVSPTP